MELVGGGVGRGDPERLDVTVKISFPVPGAVSDDPPMTASEQLRKIAAQCLSCGAVYAAREHSDGSIAPIGLRGGCPCGRSELREVTHTRE